MSVNRYSVGYKDSASGRYAAMLDKQDGGYVSHDDYAALEARCAALAAENAGLKAGRKFFMYSDDSGFETYKTQEEAINAAQEMIDVCREDAYDGWPEEADAIRWGVVIQQATETDFKKPAPDNGWVGSSDYKLLPETQETPSTDAFLAEVRASGVEDFLRGSQLPYQIATVLADYDNVDDATLQTVIWSGQPPEPDGDVWHIEYVSRGNAIVRAVLKELRKGVQS